VAFIVVDNSRYAILEAAAEFSALDGLPSLELPGIDWLSMARSFGCHAVQVFSGEELADVLRAAIRREEAILVDVVVDRAVPPLLGG
jgi:benzoylformate decarboxylase